MTVMEKVRREKGITQKEVASAANVSQPFIHDLENGNRRAKPETLRRIAELLGCSADVLLNEMECDRP